MRQSVQYSNDDWDLRGQSKDDAPLRVPTSAPQSLHSPHHTWELSLGSDWTLGFVPSLLASWLDSSSKFVMTVEVWFLLKIKAYVYTVINEENIL